MTISTSLNVQYRRTHNYTRHTKRKKNTPKKMSGQNPITMRLRNPMLCGEDGNSAATTPEMINAAIADELFARGKHHMKDENWERAVDYLEMALEMQRAWLGDEHEAVERTLHEMSVCFLRTGNKGRAFAVLDQALHIGSQRKLFAACA